MESRHEKVKELVKKLIGIWVAESEKEERHIFYSDGKYEFCIQENPFEGQWNVYGDENRLFLEVCLGTGLVEWHRIRAEGEVDVSKPGDLLIQTDDSLSCMGKIFRRYSK